MGAGGKKGGTKGWWNAILNTQGPSQPLRAPTGTLACPYRRPSKVLASGIQQPDA
jgi:hypothetical protein